MDLLKWGVSGICRMLFPFLTEVSLSFIIPSANVSVKCIFCIISLVFVRMACTAHIHKM
jgi:hypothetical protein